MQSKNISRETRDVYETEVHTEVKKASLKLVLTMILFVAFFMLQKVLFIIVYNKSLATPVISNAFQVIWHGLAMDFTVAGYLSIIPAILIIAEIWIKKKTLIHNSLCIYFAITSALLSVITVLDLTLYHYWGFRLDMTPIFYFTTSPSAAFASAEITEIIIATIAIAAITFGLYQALKVTICRITVNSDNLIKYTIVMTLLTATLFIPIRGGVTVSTMNPGRAYFSHDKFLNHAATNPAFSLLYSATHQNNFAEEYRFMTDDEVKNILARLDEITTETPGTTADSTRIITCSRPDIHIIILESFSSHLLPMLGGENIAPKLDSIARKNITFTNFYANSFRTDRAIPSILSALPAQPSTSILKYIDKTEQLPSIAKELKQNGYATTYFYGGDINFANINAYLVSAGFDRILCDKNFPVSKRTSKWGVHDEYLFDFAANDIVSHCNDATPQFTVLQTSSSHEPFKVPYYSKKFGNIPPKNAFEYTDSCLAVYLNKLKESPRYSQSLVIFVPDHQGCWPPRGSLSPVELHRIPLIITGGAINPNITPCTISEPGSQIDIAATLLDLLDIDTTAFPFSKNLMNCDSPKYAVFTEPSIISIVTKHNTVIYNCENRNIEAACGPDKRIVETACKAYLQNLYTSISKL